MGSLLLDAGDHQSINGQNEFQQYRFGEIRYNGEEKIQLWGRANRLERKYANRIKNRSMEKDDWWLKLQISECVCVRERGNPGEDTRMNPPDFEVKVLEISTNSTERGFSDNA